MSAEQRDSVVHLRDSLGLTFVEIATKLRENGINTQIYTDKAKIKNQFKYANRLNIPYVIVIGEDEIKTDMVSLKNMETGEQETVTLDEAIGKIVL